MQVPCGVGAEKARESCVWKITPRDRNATKELCEYKGVEFLEGKACIDHIHMCVSIPPKYSISKIVGYLKGKSAIIIFEKYSKLKKNSMGHSFWARGYYVSTVGLDEAKIRKYIQDQDLNESIEDKYDTDLNNPF
ncbi:MAG: IS200/IS605 family transposase [Candidatus Jettenia sp. CY-1]|nr:MAG: IS200/IS605 family transposase [Candidatus Jettenia sp. CY-1]